MKLDTPKPVLKHGVIYSGDNGALECLHCAGASAKYTGRGISGLKLSAMGIEDSAAWQEYFGGEPLACEGGCTVYAEVLCAS